LSGVCGADKHGSLGQITQRIFFKDRLVTAVGLEPFVSPLNSSRLVFSVAPPCGTNEKETGAFFFDGSQNHPVQLSVGILEAALDVLNSLWSPDDKFLAVPANPMEFTLFNFQTGGVSNLSRRFYVQNSVMCTVQFRGWSPDGKKLAIALAVMVSRQGGRLADETELVSVNPATLRGTYIATMRKKEGWRTGEFAWLPKEKSFDLAIHPDLQGSLLVYAKPRSPLPAESE